MRTRKFKFKSITKFSWIVISFSIIIIVFILFFWMNSNEKKVYDISREISYEKNYSFKKGNDNYFVDNSDENFHINIGNSFFELKPTINNNWGAKYHLKSIKVNSKKLKISKSPDKVARGNIVTEMHNNNFAINYTNDKDGLRQDFVIFDGPKKNVKFNVKLDLYTNLKVRQKDDYSIQLYSIHNDLDKIDYKDLIVYDANGKIIKSKMEFVKIKDNYEVNLLAFADEVEYPVTIDPLSTSDWEHESNVDSTYTGYAVAGGCDINGDGYDDVIIGSYGFDQGALEDVGKIEAYYGSATGLALSPAVPDFIAIGNQTSQLGFSIDCAGDINNDGFGDIIVGAPAFTTIDSSVTPHDTIKGVGAFYIFYGSSAGLDLTNIDTFYGSQEDMFLGFAVAGAGDVNHDGYDDILVSGPNYDSIQVVPTADTIHDIGIVYLYLGGMDSIPPHGLSPVFNKYYLGTQEGELYGSAIAGAGNVNGDLFDDILIGAYNYTDTINQDTSIGIVHMFFGKPSGTSDTANWVKQGARQQDHFGYSLTTLGDFNNDGASDILIGANKFNNSDEDTLVNSFGSGAVFLFKGILNNNIHGLEASPYTKIVGELGNSGFGTSVSGVGDVDGDNIPDFIVGAPNATYYNESEGAIYAYYGAKTNSDVDSTYDWVVTGEQKNAYLGISVSNAGFLNSDAINDIIVGAYGYGPDTLYRGAAFAYYGRNNCGLIQYTKPEFLTFPEDTITLVSDPGICGAVFDFELPTIVADCPFNSDSLQLLTAYGPGDVFPVGKNTVTYRAKNSDGITHDSSFVVIVIDNEAPKQDTCTETTIINIGADNSSGVVNYDIPTFTDNCSGFTVSLKSGPAIGDTRNLGVYPVVYQAEDEEGNKTYCTFRVIITDSYSSDTDCNIVELTDTITELIPTLSNSGFRINKRLKDIISVNGANYSYSLLFSLIEGVIGVDVPDWVEKILSVGGSGIHLMFVNLDFNFLPELDLQFGPYYEITESSPAHASINYLAKVCVTRPEADLFGCRDTISINSSMNPQPNPLFSVDPGTLEQEFGLYFKDFVFSWPISIEASACIGIPLCIPLLGCSGCLGYDVHWKPSAWNVFDPIHKIKNEYKLPLVNVCDNSFQDGANLGTLIDCNYNSSFLYDLLEPVQNETGFTDPVEYDDQKDQFILNPNKILILGNKIPEMDLTFGRLTADELQPPTVDGNVMSVTGKEKLFMKGRIDAFSFIRYAIPVPALETLEKAGIFIGTNYLVFGPYVPKIKTNLPVLKIDVADINISLRSEFEAKYKFEPEVKFKSINLGQDMAWDLTGTGINGYSQYIYNVEMDQNIRLVIPDGQTEDMDINNVYKANGDFIAKTENEYNLDFGFNILEINGIVTGFHKIGPLLEKDPLFSIPLGTKQVQNYTTNLLFNDVEGGFLLDPDDIPPVIACNDTTVYLDEYGMAFIDMETAFDSANSYDLPLNGTGKLNLIDVFPDTIFCDDYPTAIGHLVVEDDNCNFDTCEFIITVNDTIRPFMGCVDIVAGIGEQGTYEIDADEIAIGAIDNCRQLETEVTPPILYCDDVGNPVEVTVKITDIAGNENQCTVTVTVVDTLPLLLECPYLLNYPVYRPTDPGYCTYTANDDEFEPTLQAPDCYTVITYELTGATTGSGNSNVGGVAFNLGSTTITYTATDASGNQTECSFVLIVEDKENPTVGCPDDVVISTNYDEADDYNCSTLYEYTHPLPLDNCTIVFYEVTYKDPDGTETKDTLTDRYHNYDFDDSRIFELGTTNISYLVIDTAGLTAVCDYDVTVIDDENPVIECGSVIACTDYYNEKSEKIKPNDITQIPLIVANNVSISDLNVSKLKLTNPTGDGLIIKLISPSGTTVTLLDGLCADPQNIDLSLDDAATDPIANAPCGTIANQDTFQAIEMLSAFDGEMSQGVWILSIENSYMQACGNLDEIMITICGNNEDGPNNIIYLIADNNTCTYTQIDSIYDPFFTDNCTGTVLTHNLTIAPDYHTLAGVTFNIGDNIVTWTATDPAGNAVSCDINYFVMDTEAPKFLNCPTNDYVQDAEPSKCEAYVTFSLPIAEDNCTPDIIVEQTDDTGLSSGSIFPTGMTILEWEAKDESNNITRCSLRVIVNDTQLPDFVCPDDVLENTDPWSCSALINNLAPKKMADNCLEHSSVVWQIEYPDGSGEIVKSGVKDASGEIFAHGDSKVTYRFADQPLLLLTEITHDIGILNGGMNPVPYNVLTNNDYAEITNFGPSKINISGLQIERVTSSMNEVYNIPDSTIIPVGKTLVIHFGNGVDNKQDLFFNIPCAIDLSTSTQTTYIMSFKGRVLDVVAINGMNPVGLGTVAIVNSADWSQYINSMNGRGGIYRKFNFDNNNGNDWNVAQVCDPITIGSVNPDLEVLSDNGSITALQSIDPHTVTCDFKVTVLDQELPYCGQYAERNYTGATNLNVAGSITGGVEYTSTITVNDNFKIGELALINVNGTHQNMGDLRFKLRGPDGKEVKLFSGLCNGNADFDYNIGNDTLPLIDNAPCLPLGQGGFYSTTNSINKVNTGFYGYSSLGDWTLVICDSTSNNSGELNNWELRLFEIKNYDQGDTTIVNDPGVCGALFTWTHPRLIDNCQEGTVRLKYLTDDDIEIPQTPGIVHQATDITEFFEVGITTVRYILTDGSGNVDSCDFNIEILDNELPEIVCPADKFIQLTGGECRKTVCYIPISTHDNCEVIDTSYSIEPCSKFEIGTTPVTVTITDPAGNKKDCTFEITVTEYLPEVHDLACNDLVLISLNADCEAEIDADMLLEGDNYRCYENYEILIMDEDGELIPTTPVITIDYIHDTLTYIVRDPDFNNSCSGQIVIDKKLEPEIACPPDTNLLCNADPQAVDNNGNLLTGVLTLLTCEGPVQITYGDELQDNGNCGDPRVSIVRTFYLVNSNDVTVSCTQNINIQPFDLNQIIFPGDVVLECSDANNDADLIKPENTGYPKLNDEDITIMEPLCNLSYAYIDLKYYICESSYEILRTWKVRNRCFGLSSENPLVHTQIIEVLDTHGPEYHNCPDDVVLIASPYQCEGEGLLPLPMNIEDACSTVDFKAEIFGNGFLNVSGNINNGDLSVYVSKLDMNSNSLIRYTLSDRCANKNICEFNVRVIDQSAPVATCEQYKQVSLTESGIAKVVAYDFDSGSFDNCNPVYFKVLRVNDAMNYDGGCPDLNGDDKPNTSANDVWYDDDVSFCCDDIANDVMISLRAYEIDPGNGPVNPSREKEGGDLYGHYNDCWSIVNIECKIPPILDCPSLVITCEESLDPDENPRLYPEVSSICGYDLTYQDNISDNLCGGIIKRTWYAKGCEKSSSCSQTIEIESTEPFDPCSIKWPRDVKTDCYNELASGNEPVWDEYPCNVITAEIINEDTFTFVENACYKIVREWAVIDWCIYQQNTGAEDNIDAISGTKLNCSQLVEDGYYRYTQVLMVTDNEPPSIEVVDECAGINDGCDLVDYKTNAFATDSCNVDQKYNWKYIVINEDTWDTIQYSYNYIPRPASGIKGKRSKDKLDKTSTGELTVLSPLHMGNYRIEWTVGDGCGNANSKNQYITVVDRKAPTPIMVDIASAISSSDKTLILTARSFDKGGCGDGCLSSYDNCTEKEDLYFTYSPVLPRFDIDPQKWKKQFNKYGKNFFDPETGMISTKSRYYAGSADAWIKELNTAERANWCNYIENDTIPITIQVYVWDQYAFNTDCDDNNYDFANVLLNVQPCDTAPYIVSGTVKEVNSGIPVKDMIMSASNVEINKNAITSNSGLFSIILPQSTFLVSGYKDDNFLNGITTLDLVIIQKYLLGIKKITDPYKIIAADATNNGKISAADLLLIRQVLLGAKDRFVNNSWIALSPDYVFNNPDHAPLEVELAKIKQIEVNDNIYGVDFIAVKIGDMNYSANVIEYRNDNSVNLLLDDRSYKENDKIEIPMYAKDFENIYGGQFTLNIAGMEIQNIKSGALNLNKSNYNVLGNNLIFSWNNAKGITVNDGKVLFTIVAKAIKNIKLSDIMDFNDEVAKTEIYKGDNLEIHNISLNYRNNDSRFALYQNNPNPFSKKTVISFNLPSDTEYKFTVFNPSGKIIKTITGNGTKGKNIILLNKNELKATGLLFYSLESINRKAFRKMVILK